LEPCRSLAELTDSALEFALAHPREYQLLTSGLTSKVTDERPNIEFAMRRSAQWLGGQPRDHMGLVLALFALLHGTAILLSSKSLSEEYESGLRRAFKSAVESLIAEAQNSCKRG
jgi:WHG domain-containing protein